MERRSGQLERQPGHHEHNANQLSPTDGVVVSAAFRRANSMLPVKPYTSEMPYSSSPEASAPSTKYFSPASADRWVSRANAAST